MSLKRNHLYQDLGFKSRVEMGKYMKCHFPKLAERKPLDKLWKKFIYDSIGRIAPACFTSKTKVTVLLANWRDKGKRIGITFVL